MVAVYNGVATTTPEPVLPPDGGDGMAVILGAAIGGGGLVLICVVLGLWRIYGHSPNTVPPESESRPKKVPISDPEKGLKGSNQLKSRKVDAMFRGIEIIKSR